MFSGFLFNMFGFEVQSVAYHRCFSCFHKTIFEFDAAMSNEQLDWASNALDALLMLFLQKLRSILVSAAVYPLLPPQQPLNQWLLFIYFEMEHHLVRGRRLDCDWLMEHKRNDRWYGMPSVRMPSPSFSPPRPRIIDSSHEYRDF